MCAACRLLNHYLLDGGVFNVLQGYLNLVTVANFAAPADKNGGLRRLCSEPFAGNRSCPAQERQFHLFTGSNYPAIIRRSV